MKNKIEINLNLKFFIILILFIGSISLAFDYGIENSKFRIGRVVLRDTLSGALKVNRLYIQDSIKTSNYYSEYGFNIESPTTAGTYAGWNYDGSFSYFTVGSGQEIGFKFSSGTDFRFNSGGLEFNTSSSDMLIKNTFDNVTTGLGTQEGVIEVDIDGVTRYIYLYRN